jgi:hypothetical protein
MTGAVEMGNGLRTNQSAGAGDKDFHESADSVMRGGVHERRRMRAER